jgi:RNA polymerase sigma-70 factor (ECF subfamily)
MNRDDLEALIRAHQAELFRYLRYLGAVDRAVAEDIVQETFLAAFRSPAPPLTDDVRRQAAWLRGIARNQFYAYCRRSRRSPVRADSDLLERAEALWADEFLRSGDGFDYVEALRHCLALCGTRQRRLLELRYTEGRSRAEMARLLQMTEDGIKSALQRIRALLADCIQRRLRTENA